MSNQHGVFLEKDILVATMDYYRSIKVKFTNGKKLSAALGISTYRAGQIFRILEFKPWTDAKRTTCKSVWVVPKEYRK